LGAGLVLATPGGIGPFECALIGLLPGAGAEPVLAAVLAYRIVYFVLPAALATAALAIGPGVAEPGRGKVRDMPQAVLLAKARRAECGIIRQGEHRVLCDTAGRSGWIAGRTGLVLAGLFDPVGDSRTAIACLTEAARREDRLPLIYKCNARTAAAARRAGWAVWPVAAEAVLLPRSGANGLWVGAGVAGLRRKLRRAERAGVSVESSDLAALPVRELAEVAADWAGRKGGERGFSMGRFAPGYLAGQRLYLARVAGRTVGFASFHDGRHEWTLDLMRTTGDAPDGTMHLLIAAAVEDARARGPGRLSLAAVADWPGRSPAIARLCDRLGGTGLMRFKAVFRPRYETLYAAAPNRALLALALAEVARAIHWPHALPSDTVGAGEISASPPEMPKMNLNSRRRHGT
ncbi:MAG: DUF2156 domain-containing protein, partial [Rhodobacteraceae bacterium]|nr:DUF2156 domain-containing protein [Paracoccaceae bacterium]